MEDVKLIMVTAANNNKFYNMHDNGDGTFTAHYGRVGTDGTRIDYPMSKWNAQYNAKVKKGYTDITDNNKQVIGYTALTDSELNTLVETFLQNSRQFVSNTTNVKQLSTAKASEFQDHLNKMTVIVNTGNGTVTELNNFNQHLIELFKLVPRTMSRVQDYLIQTWDVNRMNQKIVREQSLLDNIVILEKKQPTKAGQTIPEVFGFDIAKATPQEVDFIKDRLAKDGFTRFSVNRVFKVSTPSREQGFLEYLENNNLKNNDTNVKFYWHGTGEENLLSILSTGLLIKPSNASHCGSAFGVGIYNAPNADKASGYTSIAGSYWKGGYKRTAYMFLNAVIVGNVFDCKDNYDKYGNISIYNLDGDKFSQADLGYHSIYAHAGGYLKRDEVIVYNQNQVACRYLIEFSV